jgi:hypothetical protein
MADIGDIFRHHGPEYTDHKVVCKFHEGATTEGRPYSAL